MADYVFVVVAYWPGTPTSPLVSGAYIDRDQAQAEYDRLTAFGYKAIIDEARIK